MMSHAKPSCMPRNNESMQAVVRSRLALKRTPPIRLDALATLQQFAQTG